MFFNNKISFIIEIIFVGIVIIGVISLLFYVFYTKIIKFLRSKFECINECYLNRIFDKALKMSNVKKVINAEIDCSICLENGSNKFLQLNCDHLFHEKCIKSWIEEHNSCPICREDVITI